MTEFALERLNVNDDEHMLVSVLVEDGARVDAGSAIAELETSKAAVELEAAAAGRIYFLAKPGDVLKVGAPLYRIGEPPSEATGAEGQGESEPPAPPEGDFPVPPEGDLPPTPEGDLRETAGEMPAKGYAVGRAYRPRLPRRGAPGPFPTEAAATGAAAGPARPPAYVGDDPRKAAEVASLSVVNPSGLVSCLFARSTGSLRRVPQDGLFDTNFADLIIYETSRLVAQYPLLNAFYDDERGLRTHDHVEVGYSIDVADDLTVYNLGHCETLSLPEVRIAIENAMEAHATGKVSSAQLKPTTITLTDLSGTAVRHFFPLINGQQSAIIGYSSDPDGAVLLSLAFDHRAMGGRYVARFLEELVARIESHLTRPGEEPAPLHVECAYCGRDAEMLRRLGERGLLRIVSPEGEDQLCCDTCFTTT